MGAPCGRSGPWGTGLHCSHDGECAHGGCLCCDYGKRWCCYHTMLAVVLPHALSLAVTLLNERPAVTLVTLTDEEVWMTSSQ